MFLVLATACASSNFQHLASTDGQRLSVGPVTTQVPLTRETEIRDANGVRIATESTVMGYRSVTTGYVLKLGDRPIDEQDFYHLAGNRAAEDKVAAARAKGIVMNRVGVALGLGSLAAAIAIPIAAGRDAAPYAVGQVFVVAPIGLGLAVFGKRRVQRQNFSAQHAFRSIDTPSPEWATRLGEP